MLLHIQKLIGDTPAQCAGVFGLLQQGPEHIKYWVSLISACLYSRMFIIWNIFFDLYKGRQQDNIAAEANSDCQLFLIRSKWAYMYVG